MLYFHTDRPVLDSLLQGNNLRLHLWQVSDFFCMEQCNNQIVDRRTGNCYK